MINALPRKQRHASVHARFGVPGVVASVLLGLCGCGGGSNASQGSPASAGTPSGNPPSAPMPAPPPPRAPPTPRPPSYASIRGLAFGAHQSLQGSAITVYRVGSAGYGSPAQVLATTVSDSSGTWRVSFPAPEGDPLVYVTADGGSTGSTPNSAIALLAWLRLRMTGCSPSTSPAEVPAPGNRSVQHKRIARFSPGFHSAIERDSALKTNLAQRRSRKR
jgi:hypothetical protein